MRPKFDQAPQCAIGLHRPAVKLTLFDADPLRSHCRDCGCALVRSPVTRRWFYNGELG